MTTSLQSRLAEVDESIAAAIRAAGRDAAEVHRIVVTKFHPATLVRELAELGVRDVGENRQQEMSEKVDVLADLGDVRWHFIGQAQSKKARAIRAAASVVHSVDRAKIADALHAADPDGPRLDVLVQVNLTDDAGRGGIEPAGLEALAEHVCELPSLRLRGIMAVAPLDEEPARAFERLADHAARLRAVEPAATWVSAGMSHDFADAIAYGATHLRIGSAITGARPTRG